MISTIPSLTDKGKNLLMRAVAGETIAFTRFKIGDGRLGKGQTGEELNDLVHTTLEFPIAELDVSEKGYVALSGEFDSGDVLKDFTWREMGVFVKGEDDVEVLYAYANDGENAGVLRALETDILTEQTVTLIVAVGEAEHVTAVYSQRQQYTLKTDFDRHAGDTENPHKVTKKHVGLGNVPDTHPEDTPIRFKAANTATALTSGETLKSLMGKIAKAVESIISHTSDKNNPHAVTAKLINAADEVHKHSADDITRGILPVERGGTGVSSQKELNDMLEMPFEIGNFIGDGNTRQDISIGFTPAKVYIIPVCIGAEAASDPYTYYFEPNKNLYYSGDGSSRYSADADSLLAAGHGGAAVIEGGFAVGYSSGYLAHQNVSGRTYMYIAYR